MLKTVSNTGGGTTGGVVYQGTWNASTNTPTLTSGVGTKGYYYVVSVAGTTNLDGETLWGVGDWAVFNGSVWQKVDAGDTTNVTSITVTGLTGYMYANNTSPVTASTTIPNSGLANSTTTLGNATLTLGGTTTNVGNLTLANVTITSVGTTFPNSYLANSSATLGNASVTLGGTTTSVGNLTLTNVTITSGNANLSTANVSFSGTSANIGSLSVGGAANITADTGLIASFVGSATSYSYVAVQNKQTSNTAYGSYSLYNESGTVYADFGINSTTYSYSAAGFPNNNFSLPNATFLQSGGGDLSIGTNQANAVHFIANGGTSTADAMTINSNNSVTIVSMSQSTSSTATFATSSLPLVPAGYLIINNNGTNVKVPYYAV